VFVLYYRFLKRSYLSFVYLLHSKSLKVSICEDVEKELIKRALKDLKGKVLINSVSNYRSECCNAKVKVLMSPDFLEDDPKKMTIGTCSFTCSKCHKACDVIKV